MVVGGNVATVGRMDERKEWLLAEDGLTSQRKTRKFIGIESLIG